MSEVYVLETADGVPVLEIPRERWPEPPSAIAYRGANCARVGETMIYRESEPGSLVKAIQEQLAEDALAGMVSDK